MKYIILLFALFSFCTGWCQDVINVCFDKSTILSFPGEIKSVTPGNEETIDAPFKGKLVYLRAMEEDIPDSNIVIELSNGAVYVFDLHYGVPKKSYYPITASQAVDQGTQEVQVVAKEESKPVEEKKKKAHKEEPVVQQSKTVKTVVEKKETESSSRSVESPGRRYEQVWTAPDYIKGIGVVDAKMQAYIGGIWFLDGMLYFKLNLINEGRLPYRVQGIGFSVGKSGKGSKGQLDQAERKDIIGKYNGGNEVIGYREKMSIVLGLDKFSVPDGKLLFITVNEKEGARHFRITVEPKDLYDPKTVIE